MSADYCYLIGPFISDWTNLRAVTRCKIGSTSNPTQRLVQLRTANPDWDFYHVWFDKGGGAALESELHNYYRSERIGGEVYALPLFEIEWLSNQSPCFFFESWQWDKLRSARYDTKWSFVNLCDLSVRQSG